MTNFIWNSRYILKAVLILSVTFLALPSAFAGNATDSCFLTNRTLQLDFDITLAEAFQVRDQVKANYSSPADLDKGIIDVTKPPYNADKSGAVDSTCALQRALLDARFARVITYLPPGTYKISDQLRCIQNIVRTNDSISDPENRSQYNGLIDYFRLGFWEFPCTLVGSTKGTSTLSLAPASPGFNASDAGGIIPKAMVFFSGRSGSNFSAFGPANSFNQVVSNLSFKFGTGNAGAVAIDHQGAQGSVIEEVYIDATGGFAGLRGLSGSGGSTSHLTVIGGRYGIYAAYQNNSEFLTSAGGAQPSPLVSHVTLKGQTVSPVYHNSRGPLTLVGAVIDTTTSITADPGGVFHGHISMVDSVIKFPASTTVSAITSNRNVYLRNVHVLNTSRVYLSTVGGTAAKSLAGNTTGWTHVTEYSIGGDNDNTGTFPSWISGVRQAVTPNITRNTTAPGDLQSQHSWDRGTTLFPSWEDTDAINVQTAYGAAGDGSKDDAAAIQAAINNNPTKTIFLPKGNYRISKPLVLTGSTKLVGIGNVYTRIFADRSAASSFTTTPGQSLMISPNSTTATTAIGLLQLRSVTDDSYTLHWQSGANSVVRDVTFNQFPWQDSGSATRPAILIDGSGGGNWYNTWAVNIPSRSTTYRILYVNGTRQALNFYMLNPEHATDIPYQVEFNNVRNVDVFSLKGEVDNSTTVGNNPILGINNSYCFRVFGYGGIAKPSAGSSIIEVNNSSHFLLANIAQEQWSDVSLSIVKELFNGITYKTPGDEWLAVYKRGSPPVGTTCPVS